MRRRRPETRRDGNRTSPHSRVRIEALRRSKGGIVFVGASSIVRWKVSEFFPDLPVLNRGFGGSEMADTAHFAARTVLPYEPRIVVLYPGENDIARGVSPETVAAGFERVRDDGPHARSRRPGFSS